MPHRAVERSDQISDFANSRFVTPCDHMWILWTVRKIVGLKKEKKCAILVHTFWWISNQTRRAIHTHEHDLQRTGNLLPCASVLA